MANARKANPATWIEGVIREYIDRSPENTLQAFQEKASENPSLEILRFEA